MASLPFHAHSTVWPIWVSIVLTTSMLNSLSSATKMRSERSECTMCGPSFSRRSSSSSWIISASLSVFSSCSAKQKG